MNKVVLITGASRGIGAATARLLAQKGFDVCINFKKNKTQAQQLIEQIKQFGVNAIAVQADVSKEQEIIKLFSMVDKKLGKITALVNNVGILLVQTKVEKMTAKRINKILTTNITSCFLCSREAIKRMATNNGGSGGAIVNVSSRASKLGSAGEYVDYAASKGAIDTFTTGLSLEVVEQGIRVNCVRPGIVATDIHADGGEAQRIDRLKNNIPMKRAGQPHEVASAIAWLLSDQASYITGSFLDVSGGR